MTELDEAFSAGQKLAAEDVKEDLKQNLLAKIRRLGEKQPSIVGWKERVLGKKDT